MCLALKQVAGDFHRIERWNLTTGRVVTLAVTPGVLAARFAG
jgi:hypothetical protein